MGKLSNAALRLTTGALVLDAGVKKLGADEGTYAYLQQMAASGVPAVAKLEPKPSVNLCLRKRPLGRYPG